jgi:hypothetical protein
MKGKKNAIPAGLAHNSKNAKRSAEAQHEIPIATGSRPERDIQAQGQKVHERNTHLQTRKSVSNCIENAFSVFEKQLENYGTIQAELDRKFHDLAKTLPGNYFDLLVVLEMQARTSDCATKIVWALERLARLSYFVE